MKHGLQTLIQRPLATSAAVLLIILGLTAFETDVLASGPMEIEQGTGPWLNAVSSTDCNDLEAGSICAEWPNPNNNTVTVCCIPQNMLGTFQGMGQACHVALGQRAM